MNSAKKIISVFRISALCMFFLFIMLTAFSQGYVVLNAFDVNIRTGPGNSYYVVCSAGKGEIFELTGQEGDWVKVKMFSNENRYVHQDLVYFLKEFVPGHNMQLPDKAKIKMLQKSAQWAEVVSKNEAEEIIPASLSKEKFDAFRNIRYDKNMHDIFGMQGVQTALYSQIINYKEKQ
jgi:SH3-like domain-containing protein